MLNNTWKKQIATQIALLCKISSTNARIADDGLWTGNDWYNSDAKLGVKNGIPFSKNLQMTRKLDAAMAIDGTAENYECLDNVKRVMNILSED